MDGSVFMLLMLWLWLISRAGHKAFKAVNKGGDVTDAAKNGVVGMIGRFLK